MNNDLISRSALFKTWDALDETQDPNLLVDAMIKATQDAPAVDAEPVRHGRWIHCKGKSNLWYCSKCGEKIIYNPTRKTYKPEKLPVYAVNKYCRNCGAKMDGDKDAAD